MRAFIFVPLRDLNCIFLTAKFAESICGVDSDYSEPSSEILSLDEKLESSSEPPECEFSSESS